MKIKELIIDENTKAVKEEINIKLERVEQIAILSKANTIKAVYGKIAVAGHETETDLYIDCKKEIKRFTGKIEATSELFEDIQQKEWLYTNAMNKAKKLFANDVYQVQLKEVLSEKEVVAVPGEDSLSKLRENVKNWERGTYIVSRACFDKYTGHLATGFKFEYSHFYNCYMHQGFKVMVDEYLTDYEAIFVVLDALFHSDNVPEIELEKDAKKDIVSIYARIKDVVSIEKDYISSVKAL